MTTFGVLQFPGSCDDRDAVLAAERVGEAHMIWHEETDLSGIDAVIAYLQSKQIKAKTFPTTGQDASLSGLQNILKDYQCGTVYKPVYTEAQAAAAIALYLRAGQTAPSSLLNGTTRDTTANADVNSVLLTPVWVTAQNMASTVVKDGAVKASDLCIAAVASACSANGIS